MVPTAEMMLAMKLNSIGNRNKDHKRIKDLCDIAALVLFSGEDRDELVDRGSAGADPAQLRAARLALNDDDYAQASGFLGVSEDAIRSIIERLSAAGSSRGPPKR
jgi:hypothetical protein